MSIFNRLKREKRSEQQSTFNLSDVSLAEFLGIDQSTVTNSNALKVATVWNCVRILSTNVAKLPLKLYDSKNKAVNHPLYNLLKLRPNQFMSSSNFWKSIESNRALHGNAFAYIDYDSKGKIRGLYPIDTNKVEVVIDDVGLLGNSSKVWYIVKLNNGKQAKFKHTEILHFLGDITINGVYGLSPIEYLKCTLENSKASETFINQYFKNGLQIKGVLKFIGDLNKEGQAAFLAGFKDMAHGLKNAGGVAVLPMGFELTPINVSLVDSQFLENSQLTMRQICSAFGIHSSQVNDLQKSSYSSLSEQNASFYTDTLMSILVGYEQELNYKLLLNQEIEMGLYFKFGVDAILRMNLKDRYEAYRTAINAGFLTINECRQLEDREALNEGDKLIINGNMIPVDMVGQQYINKTNPEGGDNKDE